MNATSAPSAPGRGCSSISRTPRAFSCASAARCLDAQRDVMQARTALLDVFGDRRVGRRASSSSSADSPTGTKCARTRCDATSSGASTSSPSASR